MSLNNVNGRGSEASKETEKYLIYGYLPTIGIECHVQLATKTKLFSGADNDAREAEPNSKTSPIDFALPGMLPVLNKEAVRLAVRLGLALNAKINLRSRFDRKHYFYPDLPKGYQISQFYQPIIGAGWVDAGGLKVRVEHAHLEEDAGKLTHVGGASLVDLNRAGTPLLEIVSMPDMHSAADAKAYCLELQRLAIYAGASDANLYYGNMRFDVNISVAKQGAKKLGTRAEIKNLNSFRSVERAVEYEFERQVELLEKGEKVKQETRGWSEAKGKTLPQRSKEEAQDYRYMPEPDVPPVVLSRKFVDEIKANMPLLPEKHRACWAELGLSQSVVEAILDNLILAQKLTTVIQKLGLPEGREIAKIITNWFANILLSEENAAKDFHQLEVEALIELAEMTAEKQLNSNSAKDILLKLLDGKKRPKALAEEMNLLQVSDSGELEIIVDKVLGLPESAQAVSDIKAGQMKAIGFLVGQVMKESKGKANPSVASEIIRRKIND
ncbi:MAG: Asp-tRNA(Asn)/Glu-tRNA(Gln) amidotransferase subunit GatB [Candidatus Nomurabacteria bacterium]|jgi:aspartyl-tRNA(Asn)/glutamyl-tRNA(Gln) amidotransferase subunit B|nr:Asp-tRNA(Asn)/Glu-tRNA(Gln) amidotransferase subunit GatB [Candidatus Nomurabacteria bacterium]